MNHLLCSQIRGIHVRQRGAALVVALTFLVALTLLGLAAMGGNTLQQRMTYNVGETNLAFQAAESALTTGEMWIDAQVDQPVPDCADPCGDQNSVWPAGPAITMPEVSLPNLRDIDWWQTQGRPFGYQYTASGKGSAASTGQQFRLATRTLSVGDERYPRYVVEELGEDPESSWTEGGARTYTLWYYRVTGRGTGAQPTPVTLVQSVYSKGY